LGCDSVACASQIGGALNAKYTLTGSVSKLANELVVTATLFDNVALKAAERASAKITNDESLYQHAIELVVARLFGLPEPSIAGRDVTAPGSTENPAGQGPQKSDEPPTKEAAANAMDAAAVPEAVDDGRSWLTIVGISTLGVIGGVVGFYTVIEEDPFFLLFALPAWGGAGLWLFLTGDSDEPKALATSALVPYVGRESCGLAYTMRW